MQPSVVLKSGREKTLINRHPWVFSGAIEKIIDSPQPGETVMIRSSLGEFIAWGAFSPVSKIITRIWSWNEKDVIGTSFIKEKISLAIQLRQRLISPETTNAMRMVYAESDGLPGIIVDKYADVLVVQLLSAGAERWKSEIADALVEITGIQEIYERSDVDVRRLEGLSESKGWLRSKSSPEKVEIVENGIRYLVDFPNGQKTGFYLDQRRNRNILKEYSKDVRGLNCFCYTGGFTLNALKGGATGMLSIDSSGESLFQAKLIAEMNGFIDEKVHWQEGDVFQELRKFRDRNEHFELIVLDPPKFATSISQVEKASRAYKDINLLAFKLLNPGGVLFTFSCSGGVSPELFQKIVAGAAVDAGADVQIVQWLTQDVDHPVLLSFPESAYLKGLVCVKRG
jgi:23S rRNA (cytosine1962-C5)-methyltransferase